MNSNQLLIVPNHIAKLASELYQFQWFLDDDDITVSCDAIELQLNDEIAILLHDLKDHINQVDAVLCDICETGCFVKSSSICHLSESLNHSCTMLRKLQSILDHHNCSSQARKDTESLKVDYEFFECEIKKWVKDHQRNHSHSKDNDDDQGGSPVHACDLTERNQD